MTTELEWWERPPYTVECSVCGARRGMACTGEYLGQERTMPPHAERIATSEQQAGSDGT